MCLKSIVRRAVGEFAPVVADGMQMPETVQRSLGEELMLGAEENDVSLIAKVSTLLPVKPFFLCYL